MLSLQRIKSAKKKKTMKSDKLGVIRLRGVRVNNLKNISLDIPHNKLIVVTGVSGSGKSSLAFDTLYAEGQRRYVESLNTYARQFLGRMNKPECDFIEGIPPAIAIEQKVISRNPRSTVGTSTEIYDYLRMLFARIGHTFSPVSGKEVKKHTIDDIIKCVSEHPSGTRMMVESPIILHEGRTLQEQLDIFQKEGYARVVVGGEVKTISDLLSSDISKAPQLQETHLLVDRLVAGNEKSAIDRLSDSVRTAMYEGQGVCMLRFLPTPGISNETSLYTFSTRFEADGITFEEPSEQMFSFNSPIGACPECGGFGRVIGIDEGQVIPNTELSLHDGAVVCWRGEKMSEWKNEFIQRYSPKGFPIFAPYYSLPQEQKDLLWHGDPTLGEYNICIDNFFEMLRKNQYKIQYRVMLARYRGKTTCPVCHGSRLKASANYVKIGGKSISDLINMPICDLRLFFQSLVLSETDAEIGRRLLTEIGNRLRFLEEVGLGYLTLSRTRNTLSGGESQRVNLASSLGSSLVGSLYILDEPSIGLHPRDTKRLIHVLQELKALGNTVIVVEHDEDIMKSADYIIDMGPDAGRLGGEVVWQGNYSDISKSDAIDRSHTLQYLLGKDVIQPPATRRVWNQRIIVRGARENNLKGIDVEFPLNVMTVVTGVSGSGKSTLVNRILYNSLKRHFDEPSDRPGQHTSLEGDLDKIKRVIFVDQNSIGTSSRSNPVTYIGAYDEIRQLMSQQQLSLQMNYTPSYFSFNTSGGRCEECKGEGTVTVEMQFMNDLVMECESCHGQRFKRDILEVRYDGQNINDILNMTINQAIEFFGERNQKKILTKLKPLQDVGLGYLKLGQSSSTLSGGENQRVKLAYYLSLEKVQPTLFIFDEPTTGLHAHDIKRLLIAFDSLIKRGHTILVIEHNMEVIQCADHIIDMGPEGGNAGGNIVACGTPEEISQHTESHTGRYLKKKLQL